MKVVHHFGIVLGPVHLTRCTKVKYKPDAMPHVQEHGMRCK